MTGQRFLPEGLLVLLRHVLLVVLLGSKGAGRGPSDGGGGASSQSTSTAA